jgi:hypothetical protein
VESRWKPNDDLVMIGRDIPGIDAHYGRPGDNHASSVFAVRDGRIVAPHNCPTVTDGTPAHGRGTPSTPPTAAEQLGFVSPVRTLAGLAAAWLPPS